MKKFVIDPDPGKTLIRIRIQGKCADPDPGKMIRIRIQEKLIMYQENPKSKILVKNAQIPCFACVYLNIT